MRNIITQSTSEQLRFPASNGLTIRADFDGGVLSTDLGPLVLGGIDQQIQLTHINFFKLFLEGKINFFKKF